MGITFVSRYPDAISEREGMMQRVKAVDFLVNRYPRQYLELYYKGHYCLEHRNPIDNLDVLSGNMFVHSPLVLYEASRSPLVYVHSIYNALKILPVYQYAGSKIITDLHGIVPEELQLQGHRRWARLFGFVESLVVRKSRLLITVSDAMSSFLIEKYPHINLQSRLLRVPIIDFTLNLSESNISFDTTKRSSQRIKVVYAGGIQSWQNMEKVLEIIAKVQRRIPDIYEFSIFVPQESLHIVRKMATEFQIGFIHIESLARAELLKRYQEAHLGFILRDDIPVNRVAMPTKLMEYLEYGLIPLVLSSNIGDYPAYGYQTIDANSWGLNPDPNAYAFELMRIRNYEVINTLRRDTLKALDKLQQILQEPVL